MVILNFYGTHKSCSTIWLDSLTKKDNNATPEREGALDKSTDIKF